MTNKIVQMLISFSSPRDRYITFKARGINLAFFTIAITTGLVIHANLVPGGEYVCNFSGWALTFA